MNINVTPPYAVVFYDEHGEVQLGVEGQLPPQEVELMLEAAIKKMYLHFMRKAREQANKPDLTLARIVPQT